MATAPQDALVERIFSSVLGMADVYMIYVGDRLGLYEALAPAGGTASQVAAATGTNERYVREWLEHQAVAGMVDVDDPSAGATERRYSLPPGRQEVLLDRDSLSYMAAFTRMMAGIVRPLPDVLEAFRSGGGVPYARYDADFLEGQADMNRVQFVNLLGPGSRPSRRPEWPTSRAAGAGQRLRSRARIRRPAWTASTSTRCRSRSPRRTWRPRDSTTA
jgi:hypothetical protein